MPDLPAIIDPNDEPIQFAPLFHAESIIVPLKTTTRVILANGAVTRVKASNDEGHVFCRVDDENFVYPTISHKDFYRGMVLDGTIQVDHDYYGFKETIKREKYGNLLPQKLSPRGALRLEWKEYLNEALDKRISETKIEPTYAELKPLLATWTSEFNKILYERYSGSEGGNAQRLTDIPHFPKSPNVECFMRSRREFLFHDRDPIALARKPTKKNFTRNKKHYSEDTLVLATQWADKIHDPTKRELAPHFRRYREFAKHANKTNSLIKDVTFYVFKGLVERGTAFERMLAREGAKKARMKNRPQRRGMDTWIPGERVEFDSKVVDLRVWLKVWGLWDRLTIFEKYVAETLRVRITVGVCVATGYIAAFKMSRSESADIVLETLEMAVSDKSHIARAVGAVSQWFPVLVRRYVADNGSGFKDRQVVLIAGNLGMSPDFSPAESPWLRGTVEGTLRVIGKLIGFGLPGQTFRNVVEKGDHDPEETAGLLVDEFYALSLRLILDYHHPRISKSRGDSPLNLMARYLSDLNPDRHDLVSPHTIRHNLGFEFWRVIRPSGILMWGVWYYSDELIAIGHVIGEKKLLVKSHGTDIRWISVQRPDGEFITVPTRNDIGDEPISQLEWISACRDVEEHAERLEVPYWDRMCDALEAQRKSGESAVLRARVTMHPPTPDEIREHYRKMFEGRDFGQPVSARTIRQLPGSVVNTDHLREGGIWLERHLEEKRLQKAKEKRAAAKPERPIIDLKPTENDDDDDDFY
jgi:transposase InsO family protein